MTVLPAPLRHAVPLRQLLTLGGVVATAAAAVSAEIAWLHMDWTLQTYGVLCGAGVDHCPACPAAALSAALGAGLLIAGRRVRRTPSSAIELHLTRAETALR
jgi:hypothetical protein